MAKPGNTPPDNAGVDHGKPNTTDPWPSQTISFYRHTDSVEELEGRLNTDVALFAGQRKAVSVAFTSVTGIGPIITVLWEWRQP